MFPDTILTCRDLCRCKEKQPSTNALDCLLVLLNFLLQVLVGETYSILNPEHASDYNVHDSKVEQEGAKGCEGKVLEKRCGGRDNHTNRKEQCEYVEHESGHTFAQGYEKFCSRHKNFLLI